MPRPICFLSQSPRLTRCLLTGLEIVTDVDDKQPLAGEIHTDGETDRSLPPSCSPGRTFLPAFACAAMSVVLALRYSTPHMMMLQGGEKSGVRAHMEIGGSA
jgi:hypothetical protein